jgi:hypothetical protein
LSLALFGIDCSGSRNSTVKTAQKPQFLGSRFSYGVSF